jgi:hypothetical protein
MGVGEKHIAELRWKLTEGLIAAIQMEVMSGVDPNAKDTPKEGPGFDPDAVG